MDRLSVEKELQVVLEGLEGAEGHVDPVPHPFDIQYAVRGRVHHAADPLDRKHDLAPGVSGAGGKELVVGLGQEAASVGAIAPLRKDDYLTYTHRAHGSNKLLPKGISAEAIIAEHYGKVNGGSSGMGAIVIADVELDTRLNT